MMKKVKSLSSIMENVINIIVNPQAHLHLQHIRFGYHTLLSLIADDSTESSVEPSNRWLCIGVVNIGWNKMEKLYYGVCRDCEQIFLVHKLLPKRMIPQKIILDQYNEVLSTNKVKCLGCVSTSINVDSHCVYFTSAFYEKDILWSGSKLYTRIWV